MTRLLLSLALATAVQCAVQYAGVNIAGCDFGCTTDGTCTSPSCPSSVGPTQMQHFSQDDGLNIFRLPVGWQYLVNHQLGGTLDENFMSTYDSLLGACLYHGGKCIIDIHNYARWNGQIIGQSSVTNDQFVSLWRQLASRYKGKGSQVVFGVMNEPHDLDINAWAGTLQAVVTAIRNEVGNNDNMILLSGTNYDALGGFGSSSGPALSSVKNPDGSYANLIYEVHQYYDSDSSGTTTQCASNHVSDMQNTYNYLQAQGRQALLTETGGGSTASCYTDVCAALDWMNYHADVFLGWVGWAAGSFASNYALSEVPVNGQDTGIVSNCIVGKFPGHKRRRRALGFKA